MLAADKEEDGKEFGILEPSAKLSWSISWMSPNKHCAEITSFSSENNNYYKLFYKQN